MLMTRSWMDRRMLASPGVDLRREAVSSVTHVSSLGFFSADGVPFYMSLSSHRTTVVVFVLVVVLDLASVREEREKGDDAPATRPADMPPVSVGRPTAAGHATGVVLVGFRLVLIG